MRRWKRWEEEGVWEESPNDEYGVRGVFLLSGKNIELNKIFLSSSRRLEALTMRLKKQGTFANDREQ